MHPIAKQRIDNSVYEQLLQNIQNGVWKSGEKLPSEGELCTILQVSRVSVRSALQRLQALGFIDVKRAKGSFVRSTEELFDFTTFDDTINLTPKDFKEIAELREMVEEASIRILVQKTAPVDFSLVTEAYKGMADAVERMDLKSFTLHDLKFHIAVIMATGNERMIRLAHIFREDFFRFLSESNKFILRDLHDREKIRKHFEESLVWHTELHDALVNHREDAVDIQQRHLSRNIERLNHYYRRQTQRTVKQS